MRTPSLRTHHKRERSKLRHNMISHQEAHDRNSARNVSRNGKWRFSLYCHCLRLSLFFVHSQQRIHVSPLGALQQRYPAFDHQPRHVGHSSTKFQGVHSEQKPHTFNTIILLCNTCICECAPICVSPLLMVGVTPCTCTPRPSTGLEHVVCVAHLTRRNNEFKLEEKYC